MSKHLRIADEIKSRLDDQFTDAAQRYDVNLAGVSVIVDRQKDLLSQINTGIAKASGCAVTVLWTGFRRTPTGERTGRYIVRVFARPVMLDGNYPADEIVERIDEALNDWVPPSASPHGHCHYRVMGEDAELVPDKNYLIYEMPFAVKI
jgi:hypothetical protein